MRVSLSGRCRSTAQKWTGLHGCGGLQMVAGSVWGLVPVRGGAAPRGASFEESWLSRMGSDRFADLVDYTDTDREGARRYDAGEHVSFLLLPPAIAAMSQVDAGRCVGCAQACHRADRGGCGRVGFRADSRSRTINSSHRAAGRPRAGGRTRGCVPGVFGAGGHPGREHTRGPAHAHNGR